MLRWNLKMCPNFAYVCIETKASIDLTTLYSFSLFFFLSLVTCCYVSEILLSFDNYENIIFGNEKISFFFSFSEALFGIIFALFLVQSLKGLIQMF